MNLSNVPDVSVIICAYADERWHDLVAAVESLQQQSEPPREIIVVIDHNTRLLERARAELTGSIVTENCGPRGLSGARNSGIEFAHGALIAFLDDDAVAEPDWLALLSRHCVDPRVLGVGGAVIPRWLGTRPDWFPEEFYWVVGCTYRSLPRSLSIVRNPYGGCMCLRREVFEIAGNFKHEIGRIGKRPLGGEETELCIRAKWHWPQKIFLYEPYAKIHHCVPSSRTNWRYFLSRCYAEGLSKATITRLVGVDDGLACERVYILRALPMGILRGIKDAVVHGDSAGLMRAAAIVAGFVTTMAGYIRGSVFLQLTARKRAASVLRSFRRSLLQYPENG